jgi:hypothetical protein
MIVIDDKAQGFSCKIFASKLNIKNFLGAEASWQR